MWGTPHLCMVRMPGIWQMPQITLLPLKRASQQQFSVIQLLGLPQSSSEFKSNTKHQFLQTTPFLFNYKHFDKCSFTFTASDKLVQPAAEDPDITYLRI